MKQENPRVGPARWLVAFVAFAFGFAIVFMADAGFASGGGGSKPKMTPKTRNYVVQEAGDVSYVKLNVMMLPIFKDFKLRARIALGIDFETESGDKHKVIDVLPRL